MARCGKAAYCLPNSPTARILDQRAAAGMGVQSLMVDYVQQVTAGLTRALTDDGTLGAATRDLLAAQHAWAGTRYLICKVTSVMVNWQRAHSNTTYSDRSVSWLMPTLSCRD